MAHSLTNAKAGRFMERVSEFSTHGSRRGFVDDGEYVLGLDNNRYALAHQCQMLCDRLAEMRKELGVPKRKSLKRFKPSSNKHLPLYQKALETAEEAERLNLLLAEIPKENSPPRDFKEACLDCWREEYPDMANIIEQRAREKIAKEARRSWRDIPA